MPRCVLGQQTLEPLRFGQEVRVAYRPLGLWHAAILSDSQRQVLFLLFC
jgi:hypothetical protein